eukprot:945098-Lingulodinium_polyedra.AAC.1
MSNKLHRLNKEKKEVELLPVSNQPPYLRARAQTATTRGWLNMDMDLRLKQRPARRMLLNRRRSRSRRL